MPSEEQTLDAYFSIVIQALEGLDRRSIHKFADLMIDTYKDDKTIFFFGNGGSGSSAAHFCGDLLNNISIGLARRFKAICLNDNIPALTAIANDISYENIFVEQLKNFARPGDLVVGFSGSGNSKNVLRAFEYANTIGAKTLAICGFKGGKAKELAQYAIHADVQDMEASEDAHLFITHCVKKILLHRLNEQKVF